LYNLAQDPGETINIYEENPAVVKKLKEKLNVIRNAESTR